MIEQIEQWDWKIDNSMSNDQRRQQSISAYYLNEWYSKVESITFKTHIYPITDTLENACPEILPFEKSMVRYENKSPKDSEFWGPVTSKNQLLKIFNTSLRCITTHKSKPIYKYLCIREWQDNMGLEYRCFWNKQLVAVGTQSFDDKFNDELCQKIMTYVKSINSLIPYHRCVFDIALIDDKFKLIEFNSWETNSGSAPFDWTDDTEILYPDFTKETYHIVFRSFNGELSYEVKNDVVIKINPIDLTKLTILKPNKPSNWLVTDKYIYVTTDVWLGMFNLDLKPINWKRGIFRFTSIRLCKNSDIFVNNEYLHMDLSKSNQKSPFVEIKGDVYSDDPNNKYGFYCLYDNKIRFCSMTNEGVFYFEE
jgi:hypothetical protein